MPFEACEGPFVVEKQLHLLPPSQVERPFIASARFF
jgi:hypothetical protein